MRFHYSLGLQCLLLYRQMRGNTASRWPDRHFFVPSQSHLRKMRSECHSVTCLNSKSRVSVQALVKVFQWYPYPQEISASLVSMGSPCRSVIRQPLINVTPTNFGRLQTLAIGCFFNSTVICIWINISSTFRSLTFNFVFWMKMSHHLAISVTLWL